VLPRPDPAGSPAPGEGTAAPQPGAGAPAQTAAPGAGPAAVPNPETPAVESPPSPSSDQAPPRAAEAPVLTPPVPISLTVPAHPQPYQMVVESPGLTAALRAKAVDARVRLRLLIRVDGTVGRAEVAVASGRPDLDEAAVAAAWGWRFLPATRDGRPIESIALVWVAFTAGP
jgi:protein TonB